MAGLVSGPKAPSQPQIVYIPQPVYGGNSGSGSGTASPGDTTDSDSHGGSSTGSQTSDEQRVAGILASQRGRVGTIRTGYKGILQEKENRPKRKTLLGE